MRNSGAPTLLCCWSWRPGIRSAPRPWAAYWPDAASLITYGAGSKSGSEVRRHPVVIIDTIGDLFSLYGAADLAFVGGSLVPHGGQNILEPAAWGLAPLYGPNLQNFRWARANPG